MNRVDDDVRRALIDDYGVLTLPPAAELEGLVRLAALVCDVPKAVINVIDDRHQHQIAAVGFEPAVCRREDSMCAVVFRDPGHVVVEDAALDDRFAQNPFVTGEIARVRFYASSPLVTPVGVAIGTLCVFDDVARGLADDADDALALIARQIVDVLELRRVAHELEDANGRLDGFAAQVAHDLRNPLTALTGYIDLAADVPDVAALPAARRSLSRARSAAERMSALISRLLGFARLGRDALQPRSVEIEPLVSQVVEELRAAAPHAAVSVSVEGAASVDGDPTLLGVLLENLVGNAVKFAGTVTDAPRVLVTVAPATAGVSIIVDDNGPGIPVSERERVFEPLERGSSTGVPGFGIGLTACRRAVDAHRGRMWIEDSPLGGARVWAFLPST